MLINNITVVGARGGFGSEIIKALLEDGGFTITAMNCPTSTHASHVSLERIKITTADFGDSAALVAALYRQDAVVCCVPGGATKFGPQNLLIDAAIEAGVKLFFASEFAADAMSPHYQMFPTEYVGDKAKVKKYLEEKAAQGNVAWTALNGGPFFDMWLNKGVAGFNIAARKATIYGAGINPSCWTPLPVVACTAATMLRNPEAILNRPIFICGVRNITQNNILAALEAELGDDFEAEYVNVKKIKEEAIKALKRDNSRQALRGLTLNSQSNEEDGYADF